MPTIKKIWTHLARFCLRRAGVCENRIDKLFGYVYKQTSNTYKQAGRGI